MEMQRQLQLLVLVLVMLLQLVLVLGNAATATTAADSDKLGGKEASQYVTNDRFAVITGTITINNGNGIVSVDYPTGFSQQNCVPISYGFNYVTDGTWLGFGVISGTFSTGVRLAPTKVTFMVNKLIDGGATSFTTEYKLVLMKIS